MRSGDDVDPAELADTRAKADAEAEVETGRKARAERKRADREQSAAAARADEIAAGIDPNHRATADEKIAAAWENYLAALEEVVADGKAHNVAVAELARACREAGVPVIRADQPRPEGDAVVASIGDWNRQRPTWRGVSYGVVEVESERLPHNADKSPRRQKLDRLRGRMT
ncbi:hypothetical protein [Dietzia sp. WMMA184]|uniref:hypothetical protein n=1 Tax=Dietzia sp. WMMA184 TaxID=2039808 RepID=UPI0011777689|nr:hypothetical protein [Dietzia sp. WMMA184]